MYNTMQCITADGCGRGISKKSIVSSSEDRYIWLHMPCTMLVLCVGMKDLRKENKRSVEGLYARLAHSFPPSPSHSLLKTHT